MNLTVKVVEIGGSWAACSCPSQSGRIPCVQLISVFTSLDAFTFVLYFKHYEGVCNMMKSLNVNRPCWKVKVPFYQKQYVICDIYVISVSISIY